jgi:hypothetical protein
MKPLWRCMMTFWAGGGGALSACWLWRLMVGAHAGGGVFEVWDLVHMCNIASAGAAGLQLTAKVA